jgi:hypothetical protein
VVLRMCQASGCALGLGLAASPHLTIFILFLNLHKTLIFSANSLNFSDCKPIIIAINH